MRFDYSCTPGKAIKTGSRGGSETSLNTVVHEEVKVYEPVCDFFFEISLNFFKNGPQLKVRVATMTHDHDDIPHAILTLLVVPAGK